MLQTFAVETGHASTAAVRGKSVYKNVRNSGWVKLIETFRHSRLSGEMMVSDVKTSCSLVAVSSRHPSMLQA
jgi:hypothetical protein